MFVALTAATLGSPAANTGFDNATLTITVPDYVAAGLPSVAAVKATNTGTTTWNSGYSLSLLRSGRISLPKNTVQVSGSVAPGQSQTLGFAIICNGQGLGGFTAQMNGPNGDFGASAGVNMSCQPSN